VPGLWRRTERLPLIGIPRMNKQNEPIGGARLWLPESLGKMRKIGRLENVLGSRADGNTRAHQTPCDCGFMWQRSSHTKDPSCARRVPASSQPLAEATPQWSQWVVRAGSALEQVVDAT
jgi:hypothetical protein